MSWLQLELVTGKSDAETLTKLLEQMGAVSVTLMANSDELIFGEPGQAPELWCDTRVRALLHPDTDLDILLIAIKNRIGADHINNHQITEIQDQDWVGQYKSQHQSQCFSDRIWISPSWCEQPETNKPLITLDPGLAFGTGAHPTTSLCIQWLAEHDVREQCIIDYGCGSGILAMVAAKLGAKEVFAVDIDKQAVNAAKENLRQNRLENIVRVGLVDEIELPGADVLVANILMNPLKELLPTFAKLIRPDGQLVLSGLLETQAEECLLTYSRYFSMEAPIFEQEWACLKGHRL